VELREEERVKARVVGRAYLGSQLVQQDVQRLRGVLDGENQAETHTASSARSSGPV
jgi:hypothetical protein